MPITIAPNLTHAREVADYLDGDMGCWHSSAPTMLRAMADELERLRAQAAQLSREAYTWSKALESSLREQVALQDAAGQALKTADTYGASVELFDVVNEQVRTALAAPAQQAEPSSLQYAADSLQSGDTSLQSPTVGERVELVRSIIHDCPAIKLPQSALQKLGMTAQLVVLKGAEPDIAKFIVDCMNAALAQPAAQAEPVAFVHWPLNGPPRLVWYSNKALHEAIEKGNKAQNAYVPDLLLYAPSHRPAQAEPVAWRQALRDLAAALIEAERPDLEPCPPEMSQKLVEMAKPDSTLGILRDALASKPPAQGRASYLRCRGLAHELEADLPHRGGRAGRQL